MPPPPYLQSAAYPGARALGRGVGYDYPHESPDQVSEQELLPDRVVGTRFYEPGETEAALRARLEAVRRARGR
jgi:putative ATPase